MGLGVLGGLEAIVPIGVREVSRTLGDSGQGLMYQRSKLQM